MLQVQRLKNAMRDYDNDRWRIISSRVGNGFSAAACEAKADELEAEEYKYEHADDIQSEDDVHFEDDLGFRDEA